MNIIETQQLVIRVAPILKSHKNTLGVGMDHGKQTTIGTIILR